MTAVTRRRALFSSAAVGGALALPAAALAGQEPDAELIALCAEIDALEAKINAPEINTDVENGEFVDPDVEAMAQDQEALIERMCDIRATSLQGIVARAFTITKWAPDLVDNGLGCDGLMIGALLRDLTEGAA